mgnify:FL=1
MIPGKVRVQVIYYVTCVKDWANIVAYVRFYALFKNYTHQRVMYFGKVTLHVCFVVICFVVCTTREPNTFGKVL